MLKNKLRISGKFKLNFGERNTIEIETAQKDYDIKVFTDDLVTLLNKGNVEVVWNNKERHAWISATGLLREELALLFPKDTFFLLDRTGRVVGIHVYGE